MFCSFFASDFLNARSIYRPHGQVSVGLGTRLVRRSSGTVETETREETNLTSLPIWGNTAIINVCKNCRMTNLTAREFV